MVMLIGQVGRDMLDREAFQEIDYRRMFCRGGKWVAQIDERRADPRAARARVHGRDSGRPGPVVLALPEDMLDDEVDVADAPRRPRRRRRIRAGSSSSGCATLLGGARAAARARRRRHAGAPQAAADVARVRRGEQRAGRDLVPPPGLRRQPLARSTSATSASASIRRSRARPRRRPAARRRRRASARARRRGYTLRRAAACRS